MTRKRREFGLVASQVPGPDRTYKVIWNRHKGVCEVIFDGAPLAQHKVRTRALDIALQCAKRSQRFGISVKVVDVPGDGRELIKWSSKNDDTTNSSYVTEQSRLSLR